MNELVLSLFPGIGLLDMAFEEEGFCIVRGPDLLWGGDIKRFHPPAGKFDGVIGGPPCQAFSVLRHLVWRNGNQPRHGNLIPDFERCIGEAQPAWFLMENVKDAPTPHVQAYRVQSILLNNRWVGGEQMRLRRFSFGTNIAVGKFSVELVALERFEKTVAVTGDARIAPSGARVRHIRPNDGKVMPLSEMLRRQGAPLTLLEHTAFTAIAKRKMVGNGVPLPMGRAIAKAVRRALEEL